MRGSNKTPIRCTTPNPISTSDKIKKGIREGNTTSHHIFKPVTEAVYVSLGYIIMEIAMMIADDDITNVLK